jgi:hypothetical protein
MLFPRILHPLQRVETKKAPGPVSVYDSVHVHCTVSVKVGDFRPCVYLCTLIKKKIRSGAKSCMSNGLLIYGQIFAHFQILYIRKPFLIYDFAIDPI